MSGLTDFQAEAAEHGWECTRIHDSDTFVRLRVSGDDEVIVDLGIDAPPGRPSVVTIVGPTFDPEELAGRKLVALFDRAEVDELPIDHADVDHVRNFFHRWADELDHKEDASCRSFRHPWPGRPGTTSLSQSGIGWTS